MATSSDAELLGRVIGGKYRLDRRIGSGGMGSVWVARHLVLGAEVAVKLMSPDLAGTELGLARFEREAKASAKLKSHHIVRVQDFGVDDGTPFMVMELLEGEDLGERLKRDGPLSVGELAPLFREICKGLEVAHDAGIVHRDLKPSNVFLAREGGDEVVKLVDFGVARETKTNLVEEKTTSGTVVGSPHHMSPEQARGEQVDHRSDLWALGVLAFRALTGKRPFDGEVLTSVLLAVVSQPVPKATEVEGGLPADIDRFFAKALSRNVELRFQRARTMAEALTAIAAGADPTPFLTEALGEGREEETVPSAARVTVPAHEPSAERTGSREVGAVTAGVIAASGVTRRRPVWPWLALGGGLLIGAFFLGRRGTEAPPAGAAPPPKVPTARSAVTPAVTTARSAVSPAPVVPPPVPAPTATTSVVAVTPRPVPRPLPVSPGPAPPKPKPQIDPFTGLPASP